MVSAVMPGPKDMAHPAWPFCARFNICSSTNITVAEDILPKRARISRETARASRLQFERLFHRIEDRTAAGVHGPQVDFSRFAPAQDLRARFEEVPA